MTLPLLLALAPFGARRKAALREGLIQKLPCSRNRQVDVSSSCYEPTPTRRLRRLVTRVLTRTAVTSYQLAGIAARYPGTPTVPR